MKTKTYSIYLVKEEVTEFEEIIKNDGLIENPNPIESREFGEIAKLFIFHKKTNDPDWFSDVRTVFREVPALESELSYGVVVFKESGRFFIVAFGQGWQYINDEKVEKDFGLRVAANLLNASKINRIDSDNLSESIKTISLSSLQRSVDAFGIDNALNLTNRITGKTEDNNFENTISGATSFRFSEKMNFTDLPSFARKLLGFYNLNYYKNNEFRFIEDIKLVKEEDLQDKLDEEVVNKIKSKSDDFGLSMPGWSGEDIDSYQFTGRRKANSYPDLSLTEYRDYLGKELKKLDVATILKHKIDIKFSNIDSIKRGISVKNFLSGSIVLGNDLYAINEGDWYKINERFKQSVDDVLPSVAKRWGGVPPLPIEEVDKEDGKRGPEKELDYNKRCATEYGLICLDGKLLGDNPDEYKAFEACDLLDIRNKKLIHVKKDSSCSGTLSHLFKQGVHSARILKMNPKARQALIGKVDEARKEELRAVLEEPLAGWTVEFHIIDFEPRASGKADIPFFSKVTLKDEIVKLKLMGFDVALKFVPDFPLV